MSGIDGMTYGEIVAAVEALHDSRYTDVDLAVMLAVEERVSARDMVEAGIDRETLCVALIEHGVDLHRFNMRKS